VGDKCACSGEDTEYAAEGLCGALFECTQIFANLKGSRATVAQRQLQTCNTYSPWSAAVYKRVLHACVECDGPGGISVHY